MTPTNPPSSAVDVTTVAGLVAALATGTAKIYIYTDTGTIQAPGLTSDAVRTAVIAAYGDQATAQWGTATGGTAYYSASNGVYTFEGNLPAATSFAVDRHVYLDSNTTYGYLKILNGTYAGKYVRRDDIPVNIVGGL